MPAKKSSTKSTASRSNYTSKEITRLKVKGTKLNQLPVPRVW